MCPEFWFVMTETSRLMDEQINAANKSSKVMSKRHSPLQRSREFISISTAALRVSTRLL